MLNKTFSIDKNLCIVMIDDDPISYFCYFVAFLKEENKLQVKTNAMVVVVVVVVGSGGGVASVALVEVDVVRVEVADTAAVDF